MKTEILHNKNACSENRRFMDKSSLFRGESNQKRLMMPLNPK